MKKILIIILMILLIMLSYYTISNGVHIGKLQAFSYVQINQKNIEIDQKITEATKNTSAVFPQKLSELTKTTKNLLTAKEDYLARTAYSTEGQIAQANERETYEIEFLYERVGTYQKKEGLANIEMKITTATDSSTSLDGRKIYDLNFTLGGLYAPSFLFISDLENDSRLEFKIENFKMIPGTDGNLVTTFVVKNIPINIGTMSEQSTTATNTNTQTNTTQQNTVTNTQANTTRQNTVTNTQANTTAQNITNTVGQ